MSSFTFMCPRARADEQGAHDITDAMASGEGAGRDDRVLYCRRCGQAVPVPDAVLQTGAELDTPVFGLQAAAATGGTTNAR